MGVRNIFLYPIEALNTVRANVWAMALIAVGSALVLHGHNDVGGNLVTGGFALLRMETQGAPAPSQPAAPPADQSQAAQKH